MWRHVPAYKRALALRTSVTLVTLLVYVGSLSKEKLTSRTVLLEDLDVVTCKVGLLQHSSFNQTVSLAT